MDTVKVVNNNLIIANYFEPFVTCEIKYNNQTQENELYLINANRHFTCITGKPNSEVLGKKFSEIFPSTRTSVFDWSQILIDSITTNEHKIIEQYFEGLDKFLKLFLFGYNSGIFHIIIQDITDKKQITRIMLEKNRQIEYLVEDMRSKNDKDSLTGLYNYQFALDSLEVSIQNYNKDGTEFSLFLLDFSNFKKINEQYGHKQADKILIQIAEVIISNTRKIDVACRYCGDKFLVIFNNIDSDISKILIDRLKKTLKKTIMLYDGSEMLFNGSMIDYSGQTAEQVVVELDEKLKKAKALGFDVVL